MQLKRQVLKYAPWAIAIAAVAPTAPWMMAEASRLSTHAFFDGWVTGDMTVWLLLWLGSAISALLMLGIKMLASLLLDRWLLP